MGIIWTCVADRPRALTLYSTSRPTKSSLNYIPPIPSYRQRSFTVNPRLCQISARSKVRVEPNFHFGYIATGLAGTTVDAELKEYAAY